MTFFRYDLQQFGIRRKLDKKQILQIFELLEIETEIVKTIVMDEDDSIKNQIVDFGKYKGDRWCDIPLNYLKWLYSKNQNGFAYAEIKRRKYALPDIENTTIHIGKYKGEKWINIPTYYLEWLLTRFEKEDEKELKMEDEDEIYRFAKAVLNKRIQ